MPIQDFFMYSKKITLTFSRRVVSAEPLYEGALCAVVLAPVVTGDITKLWAGYVLRLQVFNNNIL